MWLLNSTSLDYIPWYLDSYIPWLHASKHNAFFSHKSYDKSKYYVIIFELYDYI